MVERSLDFFFFEDENLKKRKKQKLLPLAATSWFDWITLIATYLQFYEVAQRFMYRVDSQKKKKNFDMT